MLNIGVLVKSVPDTESKLTAENGKVKIVSGKTVTNPFDEFAIEEAVRIKEKLGAKVTAVTLNSTGREDELRYAMAVGADSAILIKTDTEVTDPLHRSKLIGETISSMNFDIIITGREGIDDNFATVPIMIASILNYSFLSEVIEENIDGNSLVVRRLTEDSEETFKLRMPALITVRKGINNPRYPTLPNVMKSKKMPISIIERKVENDKVEIYYENKPEKKGAVIISGTPDQIAQQFVSILRDELRVI